MGHVKTFLTDKVKTGIPLQNIQEILPYYKVIGAT
jgi:hypothetical protein